MSHDRRKRSRPTWDQYFMEIAKLTACRSTCVKRQSGAVIVRDRRILCTGYNGAPSGMPHCTDVGCLRDELGLRPGENLEICRGLHAVQNAILQAAIMGVAIKGSIIYTTHAPCITCTKMLVNAGITEVVSLRAHLEPHTLSDKLALDLLSEAKIRLRLLKGGDNA